MLLVTQVHIGATMVSDGSLLLQDAVLNEGFASEGSYTAQDIARTVQRLRDTADKLEATRARLVANAAPAGTVVVAMQAAE